MQDETIKQSKATASVTMTLTLFERLQSSILSKWHSLCALWLSRKKAKILRNELAIMEADKKERELIAFAFNTRYVMGDKFFKNETGEFDGPEDGLGMCGMRVKKGFAWMCPTCNTIHQAIRMSVFVGLIYPSCCEFPSGTRDDKLPSKASLKRPIGMYGFNGIYWQKRQAKMD
jgi:hypothetical protein